MPNSGLIVNLYSSILLVCREIKTILLHSINLEKTELDYPYNEIKHNEVTFHILFAGPDFSAQTDLFTRFIVCGKGRYPHSI
jgi:hypothetical protein